MLIPTPPFRPYAFLREGSAGRWMDQVARAIASDARARAILSRPEARVTSDLKARVKSSGTLAIKALYWSVHCPDPRAWGGIRARTLLADPCGMTWIDLPRDPALPALAGLMAQPGSWQVLRYVPLRRATLLHQPPDGPARIVKVKRPDRATDAARRLQAAQAALGNGQPFTIPRLLETGPEGIFALSLCPGVALAAGARVDPLCLLAQIGQMHARLHMAPTAGLPPDDAGSAVQDLDLTAALLHDHMPRLAPLIPQLRDRPSPSEPVLCHGDFGFDQILQDADSLSLVDFDRCHAGEAAADIARFLVTLIERPPAGLTSPAAKAAYLDGYAQVRALPGRNRLTWFVTEAAATRLLVRLRKDLALAPQMQKLLDLIAAPVLA